MAPRTAHRIRTPACAAVLCLTLSILAPSPAAAADDDLVASLDALFAEAYPADGPGAAVRIEKGGEVILRKGYGLADLELGVAIEPDMVFRLGSITKQFTAAAILLLVEDGKIDLDAPLSKYLPDYDGPAAKVTVAQLLNHSGGLPNYTSLPEYPARMREDQETGEMVDRFRELDLEFEPGSRWSYSNSGYFLLGVILEAASGTSYEEFVEGRIFEPLGMERSRYGHEDELVPGRVAGYEGGPGDYQPAGYLSMTQPYAAGSLLSTVDDLARWDAALDSGEILTPEHRALLAEAIILSDGTSSGYSYGFSVGDYVGHRMIHHGGGINGFSTYLLRVPDEDLFVAVLSNNPAAQPGPGPLSFQAMAMALGTPLDQRPSVALSAEDLAELEGVYAIGGEESDDVRVLTAEGDHLVSQRSGGQRSEVRFSEPDHFYYPESPTHARIVRDDAGKVAGMWMTPVVGPHEYAVRTDRPLPAERQAIELPSGLLDRYVGTYQLFPGFELEVSRNGDQLSAQATGQPAFDIFPETETRFFLTAVDAQIEFEGAEDGEADSITLYQGGQEMPGERVKDDD
jgi:CubicO group peptidase (beta-lactamase class C family)